MIGSHDEQSVIILVYYLPVLARPFFHVYWRQADYAPEQVVRRTWWKTEDGRRNACYP
jgi:hypothetical protein